MLRAIVSMLFGARIAFLAFLVGAMIALVISPKFFGIIFIGGATIAILKIVVGTVFVVFSAARARTIKSVQFIRNVK